MEFQQMSNFLSVFYFQLKLSLAKNCLVVKDFFSVFLLENCVTLFSRVHRALCIHHLPFFPCSISISAVPFAFAPCSSIIDCLIRVLQPHAAKLLRPSIILNAFDHTFSSTEQYCWARALWAICWHIQIHTHIYGLRVFLPIEIYLIRRFTERCMGPNTQSKTDKMRRHICEYVFLDNIINSIVYATFDADDRPISI